MPRVVGGAGGRCAGRGAGKWRTRSLLQLGLWDSPSIVALDPSFPSLKLLRSKLQSFHRVEVVGRVVFGFVEKSGGCYMQE